MPRFRNIGAPHHEKDGRVIAKGEEFDSEHDLDEMYANKFERLEGKAKRQRDKDDSLDNSGRVMDKEEVKKSKDKKKEPYKVGTKPKGFAAKAEDGRRMRGEDDTSDEIPDNDEDEEETDEEEEESEEDEEEVAEDAPDEEEDAEEEEEPAPVKKKKKKVKEEAPVKKKKKSK